MRGSVALHCKTNPCLPQWKTSWRKTISFPRTRTLRHRCDRYIFFGICFGMLRWVRQSPRLRNSIFCVSFLWWVLFIKSRNAVCRIRGTLISGRCPISALLLPTSCPNRRDKSIEEMGGRSANHFELFSDSIKLMWFFIYGHHAHRSRYLKMSVGCPFKYDSPLRN